MRILSLLPSATEIVYALGLDADLVGVTAECDFPPAAASKPVVSSPTLPAGAHATPDAVDRAVSAEAAAGRPLYDLDAALVADLRPDLILAQDLCRVCAVPSGDVEAALAKIGSRAEVVSLDPSTLSDVVDQVEVVGRAAGVEGRAAAVAGALRERVEAVRTRGRTLPRVRTLALEWSDPPYVAGHWVPDMIAAAGGRDVLGRPGAPSRRATWDEVGRSLPETVVVMPCGYDLNRARAEAEQLAGVIELATTPAAAAGTVFAVDASSYFSRPGPRVVEGLEILAWALHPGAFDAPQVGRIAIVPWR